MSGYDFVDVDIINVGSEAYRHIAAATDREWVAPTVHLMDNQVKWALCLETIVDYDLIHDLTEPLTDSERT